MFSLSEPPLFTRLRDARRVLIAGAGGGFDVYAGIPLALALRAAGKEVHLANLSFTNLTALDVDSWLQPGVAAITPSTDGVKSEYFPERVLAAWLASEGLPSTVYAFPRVGVRPLRLAYESLLSHLGTDAIVLVDGGTDILLRGDEVGLGTPLSAPGGRLDPHGRGRDGHPGAPRARRTTDMAGLPTLNRATLDG